MWLIVLFFIQLINLSSNKDINCYFTVLYSNGSRSWCLDEECFNHLDIISLEAIQCQTNYLSLQFSSYSTYFYFLKTNSSKNRLSSFFHLGRPNLERLLQIEFLSPLINDDLFQLNQLELLTGPISNIDTYELIFNGKISETNLTLFLDRDMFSSGEQQIIDTLRLSFNCTEYERVEWELIKSIEHYPDSPCPQQIKFKEKPNFIKNQNCFYIKILISTVGFAGVIIIICLFLYKYCIVNRSKEKTSTNEWNSRTELVTMVERF